MKDKNKIEIIEKILKHNLINNKLKHQLENFKNFYQSQF